MERPAERDDALPRVRAQGTTTRYRCRGAGRPVLLLCDADDPHFEAIMVALAAGGRVIAPEEGGGDVDRLAAFLDGLGLASVPVVGLGWAARAAVALAREHPDRVPSLVLLDAGAGDPAAHAAAARASLDREAD